MQILTVKWTETQQQVTSVITCSSEDSRVRIYDSGMVYMFVFAGGEIINIAT